MDPGPGSRGQPMNQAPDGDRGKPPGEGPARVRMANENDLENIGCMMPSIWYYPWSLFSIRFIFGRMGLLNPIPKWDRIILEKGTDMRQNAGLPIILLPGTALPPPAASRSHRVLFRVRFPCLPFLSLSGPPWPGGPFPSPLPLRRAEPSCRLVQARRLR